MHGTSLAGLQHPNVIHQLNTVVAVAEQSPSRLQWKLQGCASCCLGPPAQIASIHGYGVVRVTMFPVLSFACVIAGLMKGRLIIISFSGLEVSQTDGRLDDCMDSGEQSDCALTK